jgi:hypothetical protein
MGRALAKRMRWGSGCSFQPQPDIPLAPPLTTTDDELEAGLRVKEDAFGCLGPFSAF